MGRAMGAVRPATIDDAGAIAVIHVRAWQAAYRGHMPDEFLESLDIGERADLWRRLLVQPGRGLFVCDDDHKESISGFCYVIPSRDADAGSTTAEVAAIYVDPDRWRRGIGGRLLHAALDHGRDKGFQELTLWVLEANQAARTFYEKAGFSLDGSSKDAPIRGDFSVREVRYRKLIT